jgi:hypothetical protein
MKDYYYILGVDADCTADDVKDAYRKLSKKFHPDVNQNDRYFEDRFKDIQEAYGILSDADTRKWYDDRISNPQNYPQNTEPVKQRGYPRTTAVDVIFTVVLIGITVLFGRYVIASMSGSHKTAIITTPTVAADTPQSVVQPVQHHKKKKHSYIADNYFKENPTPVPAPVIKKKSKQKTVVKAIKKPLVKIKPDTFKPKPQPVVIVQKPAPPVRTVSNTGDNNIPYSSYLRSNITGVVNMHRSGDFSSDIVAIIPTRSKVLVLQKGDSYYKVLFNGDEGYVPKWTVLTK